MSIADYVTSKQITALASNQGPGNEFFSLIMAAARFADTDNLEALEQAFPELIAELKQRYNAPGGALTDKELDWVKRYFQVKE